MSALYQQTEEEKEFLTVAGKCEEAVYHFGDTSVVVQIMAVYNDNAHALVMNVNAGNVFTVQREQIELIIQTGKE